MSVGGGGVITIRAIVLQALSAGIVLSVSAQGVLAQNNVNVIHLSEPQSAPYGGLGAGKAVEAHSAEATAAARSAVINEGLSLPGKNLTPAVFVRMPETADKTTDYFDAILAGSKNKIFKFAQMPIPIYINANGQDDLMKACQSALYMWEARSNEMVRFTPVANPEQARIQVRLRHKGFAPDGSPLGAITHLYWKANDSRNFHGGKSADGLAAFQSGDSIYIDRPQLIDINLDTTLDRSNDIKPVLLRNVLAHELGHALGLLGHSPVKSDLMYEVTDEYSRLSDRDLNTLEKLYRSKVDVPL